MIVTVWGVDQLAVTPVSQSVVSAPRWFRGDDGRIHLQYEMTLTNAVAVPVRIASLQVRDGAGRLVRAYSGARLRTAMSLLATPDAATVRLPPSTVGVVWVDLSFATARALPRTVVHRLTVDVGPGLPLGPLVTTTGARAGVARRGGVVIAPPVTGPRWVAIGGPMGPHRRALQPLRGRLRLGQRFAVDFSARLDGQARTYAGDPARNSSYFIYDQPVVSVGAGLVVEAVDRYPDQVPNHNVPVPPGAGDGNHVVVRLGPGRFAAYAHLRPGSVQVRRGQRVRAGQVLGRIGNSGESTGPHLHFQLMSGPSVLDSDGLLFAFDAYALDGRLTSLGAFIAADRRGTPVPVDAAGAGPRGRVGVVGLEVISAR